MRADVGRARVELGAGRGRDKKFFVWVTECWLNACESDMSKTVESFWYNRCRAAMPTEVPYWAKKYVTVFVRAAHWMSYFHFRKPKFSFKATESI